MLTSPENIKSPIELEPTEDKGLQVKILALFNTMNPIPEAVMQRKLDGLPVGAGGTAQEIQQRFDNAITVLKNQGLIKFDPKLKEFSKVEQPTETQDRA